MAEDESEKHKTLNGSSKTYYNVAKLLLLGLVFHVVYLRSVFDCYFTSPVLQGMKNYGATQEGQQAPAKRLVLIVGSSYLQNNTSLKRFLRRVLGDGLRADLLFSLNAFFWIENSTDIIAPYLRSIATGRGAFGISHTRVPTESRPGHVAIIGTFFTAVI